MSDTVQNILAILGTVFNMITTMLFYKACLGNKKIRVNKILFFVTFILAFGIGLVLSQVGYVGLFYSIMSFAIFFGLTLLYQSKWIIRIFTAVSYLAFSMISELISYSIILITMQKASEESMQNYSLLLSKLVTFILTVAVTLIIKKNTQIVKFKDYLCFIITLLISIATLITISFEFDTGEPNATVGICFAAVGLMIINIIVYYHRHNDYHIV